MTETTKAGREIERLAKLHGVVAERVPMDDLADTYSRLAGDEPKSDELADLVVTLTRKGHLSADEAVQLFARHVAEIEERDEPQLGLPGRS